jgi:Mor family transcriptional regulator
MDRDVLKDITKDIKAEDMPNGDMQLVAEHCGIETAMVLMEHLPAINLYIPSGWWKAIVERYIQKNHRRVDVKHLALECHVSETFVYNVIRRAREEANQTSLFDAEHARK